MFVRDYMTPSPVTASPDDLLGEALRLMKEHSIRRLPVISKGKIAGLVTEQDHESAHPPLFRCGRSTTFSIKSRS